MAADRRRDNTKLDVDLLKASQANKPKGTE